MKRFMVQIHDLPQNTFRVSDDHLREIIRSTVQAAAIRASHGPVPVVSVILDECVSPHRVAPAIQYVLLAEPVQ